jgi:hypothetical protein
MYHALRLASISSSANKTISIFSSLERRDHIRRHSVNSFLVIILIFILWAFIALYHILMDTLPRGGPWSYPASTIVMQAGRLRRARFQEHQPDTPATSLPRRPVFMVGWPSALNTYRCPQMGGIRPGRGFVLPAPAGVVN